MIYLFNYHIVFKEICESIEYILKKILSTESITVVNRLPIEFCCDDIYILFGMNEYDGVLPYKYIVIQLEQTFNDIWFNEKYMNILRNAVEIWDYSLINCVNLKKMDKKLNVKYLPILYQPNHKNKIGHSAKENIDVLFIGSINERRQKIIDELKQKGLMVVAKSNVWNEERDELIGRSKIVINIHYKDDAILETVRLSYLLTNKTFVISEDSKDLVLDKYHSSFCHICKYSDLVDKCIYFLNNPIEMVKYGFSIIKEYTQKEMEIPKGTDKLLMEYINKNSNIKNIEDLKCKLIIPSENNDDIFSAPIRITDDGLFGLDMPNYNEDELPNVSIVTITRNRPKLFKIAIRNFQLFEYPEDKLEWIIVDDSDESYEDLRIPDDDRISYYRLKNNNGHNPLDVGFKRNYGIDKSKYDYVAFMDDDDYYYPFSIRARISLLLTYPEYDCVGVMNLDIYDAVNNACAQMKSTYVSEASMAFKKSFWDERKFQDKMHHLGEGYPFTEGRRNRIIQMPSAFNIIAITHNNNLTSKLRNLYGKKLKLTSDLLRVLDLDTKLFIFSCLE